MPDHLDRLRVLGDAKRAIQARHAQEIRPVDAEIRSVAVAARDAGRTVQQIADALGMSRQRVYALMAAIKARHARG